jgi:hypothetical protein
MSMEQLFQDEALQQQLDQDGCVVVPFLSADELAVLREFYASHHPDGMPPQMRDGIHMTIWCSDRTYKDDIREGLKRILHAASHRLYQDFRLLAPVFIVKRKGDDTTFPIHQDWNVVDETQHRAFNMWIPLHDVDASNGALWIVKGSHKFPNHVRGPGYLFPRLYHLEDHIRPRMEPMAMQAGQALIFYHRVLHGSPPNQTDDPRVVVAMSVLPEAVPLHIFFQKDAQSQLECYHPHDEFIYEFENVRDQTAFHPPSGAPVSIEAPFRQIDFTEEWFDRYFAAKPKPGFWERLFGRKTG